jgi:hypothetical protein
MKMILENADSDNGLVREHVPSLRDSVVLQAFPGLTPRAFLFRPLQG